MSKFINSEIRNVLIYEPEIRQKHYDEVYI